MNPIIMESAASKGELQREISRNVRAQEKDLEMRRTSLMEETEALKKCLGGIQIGTRTTKTPLSSRKLQMGLSKLAQGQLPQEDDLNTSATTCLTADRSRIDEEGNANTLRQPVTTGEDATDAIKPLSDSKLMTGLTKLAQEPPSDGLDTSASTRSLLSRQSTHTQRASYSTHREEGTQKKQFHQQLRAGGETNCSVQTSLAILQKLGFPLDEIPDLASSQDIFASSSGSEDEGEEFAQEMDIDISEEDDESDDMKGEKRHDKSKDGRVRKSKPGKSKSDDDNKKGGKANRTSRSKRAEATKKPNADESEQSTRRSSCTERVRVRDSRRIRDSHSAANNPALRRAQTAPVHTKPSRKLSATTNDAVCLDEALNATKVDVMELRRQAMARGPSVTHVIANRIRDDPDLLEQFLVEAVQQEEDLRARIGSTKGPPSVVSGGGDDISLNSSRQRASLGERSQGTRHVRESIKLSAQTASNIEPGTYRSLIGGEVHQNEMQDVSDMTHSSRRSLLERTEALRFDRGEIEFAYKPEMEDLMEPEELIYHAQSSS